MALGLEPCQQAEVTGKIEEHMSDHPQTIQIFLPSGDPQGIRTAAITTRIVQVVEVPRLRLDAFLRMPESDFVGVYFLFGENEESGVAKAYIGQTGNLAMRLRQHNEKKDFWNRAVVVLSRTQSLTVTHGHYLEWLAISRATEAQRFELENGTAGSKPHTPLAMEAECQEVFKTLDILLTTLGYPLFDLLVRRRMAVPSLPSDVPGEQVQANQDGQELLCVSSGVEAHARYTEEGLVVLAGSYGRADVSEAFLKSRSFQKRQLLIDQGVLKLEGPRVVFARDTLFKSPSTPANYLLGRSSNGWLEWKDEAGQSFGSLMQRYGDTDKEVSL